MHIDREVSGLLRAIAQSHGGNHIALGSDAHARSPSLSAFAVYFLPQVVFRAFHLITLRIRLHLRHDFLDFLEFQVHDIVHDPLCESHMLAEQFIVEVSLVCERIDHIRIKVDGEQAAGVVGTERNFAAGVGRNRAEPEVGIAVGDALPQDGIPEEHSWLSTFPCVVNDFLPQFLGADRLFHQRLFAVYGELLDIFLIVDGTLHEFIVYPHRHISARHLSFCHLRIDKVLAVGVFDADGEHESATPSVLCHLASGVAIPLHERNETGTGESGVVHRCAFWPEL